MSWLSDPETWLSLFTLTGMEIVLGIDNIVFIAILTSRLPADRQDFARRFGLVLAMITRLGLLLTISWIMRLTQPLVSIAGFDLSGRNLILLGGGLFLMAKATHEIHARLEVEEAHKDGQPRTYPSVALTVLQIGILDIVFSLDSVITAVGMAEHIPIMATALVLAVAVMLFFSGYIARFIDRNPTMKILALSFLILIGVMLMAEALGQHISKGYVYFAMAFALGVELINMRVRRTSHLHLNPNVPE
jgi:predicted tellurium resistance membrane protein TerC